MLLITCSWHQESNSPIFKFKVLHLTEFSWNSELLTYPELLTKIFLSNSIDLTMFGICFICQILLETWDQTLHRLDINFTYNCSRTTNIFLWWNLTVNCILKAWVCFVYTRPLSQVVSLKWPDHYYLEKSRTRNSKQSVYSWRSTYRNLMYYQCKSA